MTSLAFETPSVLLKDVSKLINPPPTLEEWSAIVKGGGTERLRFLQNLSTVIFPGYLRDDDAKPENLASFYSALGLHCEHRADGEWPPMISKSEKRRDVEMATKWLRQAIDLAMAAVRCRENGNEDGDNLRIEIVRKGGLMQGVGVRGWKEVKEKKGKAKVTKGKARDNCGDATRTLLATLRKYSLDAQRKLESDEDIGSKATTDGKSDVAIEEEGDKLVSSFDGLVESIGIATETVKQVEQRLEGIRFPSQMRCDVGSAEKENGDSKSLSNSVEAANEARSIVFNTLEATKVATRSLKALERTLPLKKALLDDEEVVFVRHSIAEAF